MAKIFCSLICSWLFAHSALAYDNITVKNQYSSLSFKMPLRAVVAADRLFTVDSKSGFVVIFTKTEKTPLFAGSPGKGPKNFYEPQGIAAGKNGRLYVADTGNSRVQVLDVTGNFIFSFGSKGSEDGQFSYPQAIACGSDGRIYVADTGNSKIQVFSPDGIFLFSIKNIASPVAVAVDMSDSVYVLSEGESKLLKISARGEKLAEIKIQGNDFCVDTYGFIYALDFKKGKVREYMPDGALAGEFGTRGKAQGQFYNPTGISLGAGGTLLIADAGDRKLVEFEVENKAKTKLLPPNPATKLFLSGPVKTYNVKLNPFVVNDGVVYGYLPDAKVLAQIDDKGAPVMKFGAYGKQPGQTQDPRGLAFSKKDGFVVSDYAASLVQVFSATGSFKNILGEKAGFFDSSSKEGRFSSPQSVDINSKSAVFVADTGNARIQQFAAQGMFINSIGPKVGNMTLLAPVDVKWVEDGQLFVLDRKLKKIIRMEPSGKIISAWGDPGEGLRQLNDPVSLAYDGKKYVYVLDSEAGQVKVFDTNGNWITNFFSEGAGVGNLLEPSQIYFKDNKFYVTDPKSSKLSAYEMSVLVAPPAEIAASAKEDAASLKWQCEDQQWVKNYRVYRSTLPFGTYAQAGTSKTPEFTETLAEAHTTYYYKVAAESLTGEMGFMSNPVELFVPGSENMAKLEFPEDAVEIGYVFSSNYKYYLKNPIGKVIIANNTNTTFKNVKLSFALKDFMDYPYDTIIKSIEPRSKTEVKLMATLNNKILDVSEDTPVQAQFTLTYYEGGKESTLTLNSPIKVLSRSAIIWDKADRLANFITPKDPPVFAFGRAAQLLASASQLNPKVATALTIWSALGEYGIGYLPDPSNPYSKVKSSQEFPLDTVQMPRDTMKLKSGECDDLTALSAALLEGAGIEVALMDFPSHITLMFNTGLASAEQVGLPPSMLVKHNDTYWVPLEATMIGKSFMDSFKQAAATYNSAKDQVRLVSIHDAWGEFEPVTLPETKWEPAFPDKAGIKKRSEGDIAALTQMRFNYLKGEYARMLASQPDDADAQNSLGILYAQNGDTKEARELFEKILKKDPAQPAALNNMGNISFAGGDYEQAAEYYKKAAQADPEDGDVVLNQARAALQLKRSNAEVKSLVEQAVKIDPSLESTGKMLIEQ